MTAIALNISRRIRTTPFTRRVEASGVTAYTVYNHMLLPMVFASLEEDYWHLCEHVQVWDVSCQRQVEITGPDSQRLVQLMTPRDVSRAEVGQCLYSPLCDESGGIINDPIVIKLAEQRWWLSISDSDVKLWASGLATGYGLDVQVFEPDIWPLAVQGPRAEELVAKVFGDRVRDIRFFRSELLPFMGRQMLVARSGWSKQGGFEIYLNDAALAEPLWDALFSAGEEFEVRAGCPNLIERIESGLLSYGGDITGDNNPFECGLDQYIKLDAGIDSLSLPALREMAGKHRRQLVGIVCDQSCELTDPTLSSDGQRIGNITSHAWSPRYEKHLALAMLEREFLAGHSSIEINGVPGQICALPFTQQQLVQG
jgi:dimethylsulfoniopropionate demethylase